MRPDEVAPLNEYRRLRYALTLALLEAGRPMTIRELLAEARRQDLFVSGRPSKVVSDALRWEIRHRRVVRVRRGVYAVGHIPRSTQWWIRARLAERRLGS